MIRKWWRENRWLLTKRTIYILYCVIIICIPFMSAPASYIASVSVAIGLLIYFKDLNTAYRQFSSEHSRQSRTDGANGTAGAPPAVSGEAR